MNREKVAQTMEEVVSSYRKQLAINEESTVSNLGNLMKMGYESLKSSFSGSESDKHAINMFRQYADSFEDALKNNDRPAAEKALDDFEKLIQAFRIRSDAVN